MDDNVPDTNRNLPSDRFSRCVRIANPQGLHMRPAAAFARLAQQFTGEVVVRHGDRDVDGKSWVDLMLLAVMPGTEIVVEVAGPDADTALEALADLLASDGSELTPPADPKG